MHNVTELLNTSRTFSLLVSEAWEWWAGRDSPCSHSAKGYSLCWDFWLALLSVAKWIRVSTALWDKRRLEWSICTQSCVAGAAHNSNPSARDNSFCLWFKGEQDTAPQAAKSQLFLAVTPGSLPGPECKVFLWRTHFWDTVNEISR